MIHGRRYSHAPIAVAPGELHFEVERTDGSRYWLVLTGSTKRLAWWMGRILAEEPNAREVTHVGGWSEVYVRCCMNGGSCRYFTDGKVYTARKNSISKRLSEVTDDRGDTRVIALDGSKCAHIIRERMHAAHRGFHECVGTWEVVR